MSLIRRMLKEKVVYWPPAGVDGFGKQTYGTPVELKARWEDKTVEVLSEDGEKTLAKGRVFVESDVVRRGVLFHGTLIEVEDQVSPFNNKDTDGSPLVHRIIGFDSTPNLRITEYVRIAYIT